MFTQVFRSRKKRERKNRRAKGAVSNEDEIEEKLEAELQSIERPQLSGVLPVLTVKAIYYVLLALPSTLLSFKEMLKEKFFHSQIDDLEEDDEADTTGTVEFKITGSDVIMSLRFGKLPP